MNLENGEFENLKMNNAYILTGGNIGDRLENIKQAQYLIENQCGTILKHSAVYETAAWGIAYQKDFLNQVLLIQTTLSPIVLMITILDIETKMGRIRMEKNGPRTIDIDILFYNDWVISDRESVIGEKQSPRSKGDPELIIPHPQLHKRRFVLEPLNEIASEFIHPIFKKSIHHLLIECDDLLPVKKL